MRTGSKVVVVPVADRAVVRVVVPTTTTVDAVRTGRSTGLNVVFVGLFPYLKVAFFRTPLGAL